MVDSSSNGDDSRDRDTKRRKTSHNHGATALPLRSEKQPLLFSESPQKCLPRAKYTVGWISALPLEMAAARGMLDEIHGDCGRNEGDNNTYTVGKMAGHNCVIACLPAGVYGTTSAAEVASGMRFSFPGIQFWLLVGVGGGAPTEKADIRLGDVVVGIPGPGHSGVIQYDYGKTLANGVFERTSSVDKPPSLLLTAISKLRSENEVRPTGKVVKFVEDMLERHPHMKGRYSCPGPDRDVLFEPGYPHAGGNDTCDQCDRGKSKTRVPRSPLEPTIHYGAIASGNQVIKDGQTRDKYAKELGILCFEMEAAGLTSVRFLAIRGICDYSDSHKNKQWQEYSAATAAAYAKELLLNISSRSNVDLPPVPEKKLVELRKRRLESLQFSQMKTRQSTVKAAHSNTCEWLINHDKYQAWLEPSNIPEHHGFLWIKGKPGTGKSTIMKFACERARQVNQKTGVLVLSFFFNARGDDLEKSTTGMYRSLLWQLLSAAPDAQEIMDFVESNMQAEGEEDCWGLYDLQNLIRRAIGALGQKTVLCYVDALDECCEDEVRDMVDFFADLGRQAELLSLSLHTCFSSRHYPHISFNRGMELVLETQDGHNRDLVDYIGSKLGNIKSQTIEGIKKQILEMSSGIFLWVVLVIDILRKEYDRGRINALRRRLKEIPPGLTELLQDILIRDKDNPEESLVCLQWILFAKRPLTPNELYFAIYSRHEDELAEVESPETNTVNLFILSSSKGLAEVTQSEAKATVQFIHESVRDFLLKEGGINQLLANMSLGFMYKAHELLKHCCLNHITACFSDYPLPIPSARARRMGDMRAAISTSFPLIEYALEYVLEHADAAECEGVPQRLFVHTFPWENWIYGRNIFETHQIDRYSSDACPLYIFADRGLLNLVKIELRRGRSINAPGGRYGSPLGVVLEKESMHIFREMLTPKSEYPNIEDDLKMVFARGLVPASRFIIRDSEAALLKLLLDRAILDPNADIMPGVSLLQIAMETQHKNATRILLNAGASPKLRNNAFSPLGIAIKHSYDDIVELLLDRGEDPNQEIYAEYLGFCPPLYLAVHKGQRIIVGLLLDRGANLGVVDGKSPLGVAINSGNYGDVKLLLDRGADPNESIPVRNMPFYRYSPLWLAVKKGQVMVKLLLDRGANPNMHEYSPPNMDEYSPLRAAVKSEDYGVVKLLLDRGANPSVVEDGQSALEVAIHNGNYEIAKLLLDRGANANGPSGTFHLRFAILNWTHEIVKLLLSRGAEPNHDPELWNTPLLEAVRRNNPELATKCLEWGADPNRVNFLSEYPLGIAIMNDFTDMINILIANGADVNYRNGIGATPLEEAVSSGKFEAAKVLMKHPVDLHGTIDDNGATVLERICSAYSPGLLEVLHEDVCEDSFGPSVWQSLLESELKHLGDPNAVLIQIFLSKGADANTPDVYNRKPLFQVFRYTTNKDPAAVIRVLLSNGAGIYDVDKEGRTPLHWAAALVLTESAQVLLENGADVNRRDDSGDTPLFATCRPHPVHFVDLMEREGLVRLLRSFGADITIRDPSGRSALHVVTSWEGVTRLSSRLWSNVQHLLSHCTDAGCTICLTPENPQIL